MLSEEEQQEWLSQLSEEESHALLYDWGFWSRPNQRPPTDKEWSVWLILAGRGFGKTRSGAEWVREQVEQYGRRRIALVARTAADVRDVVVEGESGLIAISPPWNMPKYEPSKRRITWPNGAIAQCFGADEPNLLRGPQFDAAWCDEVASWRYREAWDNLMLGLRLGMNPQCVVTTTPRPVPIIKELVKDAQDPQGTTVISTGSTYENLDNLAPTFIREVVKRYEGTRLGQQELYAALLLDTPGALWNHNLIELTRVKEAPELDRIVIGLDPPASDKETSATEEKLAECGIIIAGIARIGKERHAFVLDDFSLQGASPNEWAKAAVAAYERFEADRIVPEINNGGAMVVYTIRTVNGKVSVKPVRATRGKYTRAEPIASLYEQKLVHHVGYLAQLEDQMTSWIPGGKSPDRMDALVWALTELMLEGREAAKVPPQNIDKNSWLL